MSGALTSTATVTVTVVFLFLNMMNVFQIRKVWMNSEGGMDLAVLGEWELSCKKLGLSYFQPPIHPDCAPFLGQSVESHDSHRFSTLRETTMQKN